MSTPAAATADRATGRMRLARGAVHTALLYLTDQALCDTLAQLPTGRTTAEIETEGPTPEPIAALIRYCHREMDRRVALRGPEAEEYFLMLFLSHSGYCSAYTAFLAHWGEDNYSEG